MYTFISHAIYIPLQGSQAHHIKALINNIKLLSKPGVTLSNNLGGVDSGSVGFSNCGWLPTRIVKCTMPDPYTSSNTDHEQECSSHNNRGWRATYYPGNNYHQRIMFPRSFCLRRKIGVKDHKTLNLICDGRKFQDGGPLSPSRSHPARRLDG